MSNKSSSRKRVVIAASVFAIFVVAAIVSIAIVLASNTQQISTNISIAYVVDGVGAKAQASYAVVPYYESETIERVSMTTASNQNYVEFEATEDEISREMSPTTNLVLSTYRNRIVFEYVFENTADSAFSISLQGLPTGVNTNETYYVSGKQLSVEEYRTKITQTTLAPWAVTEYGSKIYIYIAVNITNPNRTASYDGSFTWVLNNQDTIDINLNSGDGTGGKSTLKVIPTSEVPGIYMPVVNNFPTLEGYAFSGYYLQAGGNGTKYINANGSGACVANITAETTLYANFVEVLYNIEGTTLTSISNTAKTLQTLEIPADVKTIGANALSGAAATSVVISNNVETIGDSAFENMTNLETVTFDETESLEYASSSSKLKTIGANAFSGCSKLKNISLPESLTTLGGKCISRLLSS